MTCCQSLECVRSTRALPEEALAEQPRPVEIRGSLADEGVLLPDEERLQRWLDLNA